jgi:RimJ/RimL family protein N-acetyltransferase
MIRLEPMTPSEFDAALQRSVERHAADSVRQGLWTQEAALEASRSEFGQLLPQGHATPGRHFCNVFDSESGSLVGETWYSIRSLGGRTELWVDWIWTEPPERRKGYATVVLEELMDRARALGADRVGLSVLADNSGAMALYTKLGFLPNRIRLLRNLAPSDRP